MSEVSAMDSKDRSGEEAVDSLSAGVAQIGLNVMAPAFVPSFFVSPNNVDSSETTPDDNLNTINNTDKKQSNNEDVVDDWEVNADDDDEDDDGDDGIGSCLTTTDSLSI